MNAPIPELNEAMRWQAAIEPAASEIAQSLLGFERAHVRSVDRDYSPRDKMGAHLPLLGGPKAIELALVGTDVRCRELAAAMLQTTPEKLELPEIADAVGEALNMLGGAIKRRFNAPELELGLPLFVLGHVQKTSSIAIVALPTSFGPIEMYTLIIGRRS